MTFHSPPSNYLWCLSPFGNAVITEVQRHQHHKDIATIVN